MHMHILLIEDNPDLVANLYDYLEARGHRVDAAYDPYTGLKFIMENSYDALVLDLMLPGMDGLDACRRIRSAGYELPILILTARDTLDDKLNGFATGADDFLVKPFELQELEARLSALVRRSRGQATRSLLRVGDLVFDPDTLQIKRGTQTIQLAPTQLKLLDILMRQSPRVVPRQELERALWGDSPPDSDALRAHMHLLRSAVDRGSEQPLIRTVRGIGYQLVATEDAS